MFCCFAVVHENSQTQYQHYELELRAMRAPTNAIIGGVTPVLNFIDRNLAPPPVGDLDVHPLPLDPFVERCKAALGNFRTYMHSTAYATTGHALAVVWSLSPAVSLEVIDGRFTEGTEDAEVELLAKEATESAFRLVEDLDIFGDKEQQPR